MDQHETEGSTNVNSLRPVLTASRPSQTMAAIGPDNMSAKSQSRSKCRDDGNEQVTKPGKKGLSERSA